jgi:uncharacterized RDD family membrane protein YckC
MKAAAPAGFWRRYIAYSLDFAALGTLATLLSWSRLVAGGAEAADAVRQLSDHLGHSLADALPQGIAPAQLSSTLLADPLVQAGADAVQTGLVHMLWPWLLWYAVLAALYHIGFERSRWQGSPGKHALGLAVVTAAADGRASLPQIAVRHGAGALSWLTLNLGHALAAVPPQKRALHDYLSGTRVQSRDDNPRLPGWARAWLALQVITSVALLAWMLARYMAALQQASLT